MIEPKIGAGGHTRIHQNAVLQRRATSLLCASALMLQQACYTTVPVAGATSAPAGPVTITVNERGRVLVGSKLGSLIDHVDGRIVHADAQNVEVAVETAEDVRGNMARWGGERFTIPREGIEGITEKKTSKVRTGLLLGGIIVGIVVGILGIKGGKQSSGGPVDPGGGKPI